MGLALPDLLGLLTCDGRAQWLWFDSAWGDLLEVFGLPLRPTAGTAELRFSRSCSWGAQLGAPEALFRASGASRLLL